MKTLDDILSDVQSETTVIQSVVTLLTSLSDQLKAAGLDQAKVQSVIDAIDANKAALAAAVTANTTAPTP